MDRDLVYQKIIQLLSNKLNIDKTKINGNSYFTSDLGVTSFNVLEIVCDVEDEFHCNIPDSEVQNLQKVDDLVNFIGKILK